MLETFLPYPPPKPTTVLDVGSFVEHPAGEAERRFGAYVEARRGESARAKTQNELDRLKVRLCDRLTKELNATPDGQERLALVAAFLQVLAEIGERELSLPMVIEPPVAPVALGEPVTLSHDAVKLGSDMSSGESVTLPLISRMSGTYVVGKNGTGKTSLLLSMMRQDMEQGRGLCFLDPAGDAALELLSMVPEHRRPDVRFMDASDERHLFGLNMFHNDGSAQGVNLAAGSAVQVFKRAWGGTSWGPNLAHTLHSLSYVMAATGGTLADCPEFMRDERVRAERLKRVASKRVVVYWRHEYDQLSDAKQRESRGTILNKIEPYLLDTAVERIVNGSYPQVDFRQAMDTGQILIVRLPEGHLGEGTVGLLGATIVEQIAWAVRSRINAPQSSRRPFLLFADEFQLFATPVFAKMIEQLRKYGLGVLMAHQRRSQLSEDARDAALGCRNFVVFEVSGQDAAELSREFAEAEPELMTPPDLYAHLERKGNPDPLVKLGFANIRRFMDDFPSKRAREIREDGRTPDMLAIRTTVEGVKDFLSRYWEKCQENDGVPPSDPVPVELKQDILRVCLGLGEHPVKVPHRTFTPEESLTALAPFTAKVKWRDDLTTRQATIRTIEPPQGSQWRPAPSLVSAPERIEPPEPHDDEDLFFDKGSKDDVPPISEPYKPR